MPYVLFVLAGKPGAVLELKAARQGVKTIEKAMTEGLAQFADNDYAAELRNAGVEKIAQIHGMARPLEHQA